MIYYTSVCVGVCRIHTVKYYTSAHVGMYVGL